MSNLLPRSVPFPLFVFLLTSGNIASANSVFSFGPISSPILSAAFNANLAEFSGDQTVFGAEVNFVNLLVPGFPTLDLSDELFGGASYPATPKINMGPTQTGVVSAAIPSSFFPALATGAVGYNILFTDTTDGIFALDFISLTITTSQGTIDSVIGPDDGFGLGVPPGGNLPSPLPASLPFGATGTGFDESITSKALQATVPEPSAFALTALALAGLLFTRRLKAAVITALAALACAVGASAQSSCPPVPQPAAVAVPGKPGESGWLIENVEADANGNKIQVWCLKSVPGPNPPKHGGPDFALLYKPAGAKDADAVWVGACTFPRGRNDQNKEFTKLPNGQPKQFTKLTWFNREPPPGGTNDWDYSYDTASGKLTLNKTMGAYAIVVGTDAMGNIIVARVYTSNVTGTNTYAAPKNFGDITFTSGGTTTQVTQASGPDGVSTERFTAVASVAGNNWSYALSVNSYGGSGTMADPYEGEAANIVAGDTFSITGAGIQNPFAASPASLTPNGGWAVQSSGSDYVTFVATAPATYLPGTRLSGFEFSSTAPPGTVAWNLASSNETIGSSGVVNGPMTPADQLHIAGPSPNQIPVGQDGTIVATVESAFTPMPGMTLTFTKLVGDFTFNDGVVSAGGATATLTTATNGAAVMEITGGSAGLGLVQVNLAGTSLKVYALFMIQ